MVNFKKTMNSHDIFEQQVLVVGGRMVRGVGRMDEH